jgi:hypothetical protein
MPVSASWGSPRIFHSKAPREHPHPWASSSTTSFTGVYKTIIPLTTRLRESLYKEVCLLHQNLPEGWTTKCV